MQYNIDPGKHIGHGKMKDAYETMISTPSSKPSLGMIIENPEGKEIVAVYIDLRKRGDIIVDKTHKKYNKVLEVNLTIIHNELKIHHELLKRHIAPEIFGIVFVGENNDIHRKSLTEFIEDVAMPIITKMVIYEERCGKSIEKIFEDDEISVEDYVKNVDELCTYLANNNIMFMDIKPPNTCMINGRLLPIDFDEDFIELFDEELTNELKEAIKTYMVSQYLCTAILSELNDMKCDELCRYMRSQLAIFMNNKNNPEFDGSSILTPVKIGNSLDILKSRFCYTNTLRFNHSNPIKMLYYYIIDSDNFEIPCQELNIEILNSRIIHLIFRLIRKKIVAPSASSV